MSIRSVALYQAITRDVGSYVGSDLLDLPNMNPDASIDKVAASCLLNSVLKKFITDEKPDAGDLAISKFLESNDRCKDWNPILDWESDRLLYGEFRKEVDDFFFHDGQYLFESYFDILKYARTGPGAAIGASSQSFYSKLFSSKLSSTSEDLYIMYRNYLRWFPTFLEAEHHRLRDFGGLSVVDSSKVVLVPKTNDIKRLICVEPSLNMFFQLGLGTLMEKRLEDRFGIDLSSQPSINKRLACAGSIDGSFATIDLSSASDSISIGLCRAVLPKYIFDVLMDLRSPNVTINGQLHSLNMISTMGNGFTFPLQTILFTCLLRAAYSVSGVYPKRADANNPNLGCFGDDLICSKECFRNVTRLLHILGFRCNSKKTFFEGQFRESCGGDFFKGHYVRPVYIKKLETLQDLFVAFNSFNDWSSLTNIPLRNTIQLLLSWIRPKFRTWFVPPDENADSGLRVPFIVAKDYVKHNMNQSCIYRAFSSVSKYYSISEGCVRSPEGGKKLKYNPSGLLLSFLLGEVVSCKISVRHDIVSYRARTKVTPFWDNLPFGHGPNGYYVHWWRWAAKERPCRT